MRKKTLKCAALAAMTGMVFQFGFGCLGNPRRLVRDLAVSAAAMFVLDNDTVFDLFEDGNVAGG